MKPLRIGVVGAGNVLEAYVPQCAKLQARGLAELVNVYGRDSQRDRAMALGAPKWWVTLTVIIPTALRGIITGVLLAFARATGETAPLLLTVLGNNNVSFKLLEPMAALPLLTYKYTDTPFPAQNTLAWGSALVLTLLVLGVNISVRWATRSRMK